MINKLAFLHFMVHRLASLLFMQLPLQLCIWATDTWEKKKSVTIQLPAGKAPVGDTRVQFNSDQSRLLVSHETQVAIYEASKMDLVHQVICCSLNLCTRIFFPSF